MEKSLLTQTDSLYCCPEETLLLLIKFIVLGVQLSWWLQPLWCLSTNIRVDLAVYQWQSPARLDSCSKVDKGEGQVLVKSRLEPGLFSPLCSVGTNSSLIWLKSAWTTPQSVNNFLGSKYSHHILEWIRAASNPMMISRKIKYMSTEWPAQKMISTIVVAHNSNLHSSAIHTR